MSYGSKQHNGSAMNAVNYKFQKQMQPHPQSRSER